MCTNCTPHSYHTSFNSVPVAGYPQAGQIGHSLFDEHQSNFFSSTNNYLYLLLEIFLKNWRCLSFKNSLLKCEYYGILVILTSINQCHFSMLTRVRWATVLERKQVSRSEENENEWKFNSQVAWFQILPWIWPDRIQLLCTSVSISRE